MVQNASYEYLSPQALEEQAGLIAGDGNAFEIKDDGTPDIESKKSAEAAAEILSLYNSNVNSADVAAIQ